MQLDEQQRRAWVLKHADAKTREEKIRPASLGQKTRAVHPMNVLSEQAKLWTDVWKAPNRDPSSHTPSMISCTRSPWKAVSASLALA